MLHTLMRNGFPLRPPACWADFDAVLNVTLDQYDGMLVEGLGCNPTCDDTPGRVGGEGAMQSRPARSSSSLLSPDESSPAPACSAPSDPAPPEGGPWTAAATAAAAAAPGACWGQTQKREYMHMPVAEGKRDKRDFERQLAAALRFAFSQLSRGRRLLVHCAQGMDRSVGVAVAILATFYQEGGTSGGTHEGGSHGGGCRDVAAESSTTRGVRVRLSPRDPCSWPAGWTTWSDEELREYVCTHGGINKQTLQSCLLRVSQARPCASPSRHTLKKLNRFFMTEVKVHA